MAAVTTYDGLIERLSNNYGKNFMYTSPSSNSGTPVMGGRVTNRTRFLPSIAMPGSLPTGVSQFIPTAVSMMTASSATNILIGKRVSFGSIDISGASGTFTDGSNMGTRTEFNTAATKMYSPIFVEVTTALNATPGSLTVTYVDQDNNTAETTTAQTLPASAVVGNIVGMINLNGTDVGAYDVTAATRSLGTTPTGVLNLWGMIPFGIITASENISSTQLGTRMESLLTDGFSWNPLAAGDEIAMVGMVSNVAVRTIGTITVVGDST